MRCRDKAGECMHVTLRREPSGKGDLFLFILPSSSSLPLEGGFLFLFTTTPSSYFSVGSWILSSSLWLRKASELGLHVLSLLGELSMAKLRRGEEKETTSLSSDLQLSVLGSNLYDRKSDIGVSPFSSTDLRQLTTIATTSSPSCTNTIFSPSQSSLL